MHQTILTAIREKRCLSFVYDAHPRVVEPHCYGITTAGNEAIRCYQIRGSTKDSRKGPWHLMTTNKIISLKLLEETFSMPRAGYKKGDKGMTTIFCEL